jgi:hypothetical protein
LVRVILEKEIKMTVKAKGVLEFIIDYQSDIFTIEVLDRIEKYNDYMEKNNNTELLYFNSIEDVTKSIFDLIAIKTPVESREFFGRLSDTIITFTMLRFQNYERYLESLGDGVIEVDDDYQSFLKYGLITLWKERETFGPYFRNN